LVLINHQCARFFVVIPTGFGAGSQSSKHVVGGMIVELRSTRGTVATDYILPTNL
jgi:hypothetical protein